MRVTFDRQPSVGAIARIARLAWILVPALLLAEAVATEYHVAPSGADIAPGTKQNPLSLSKALSSTSPALPGDTVWIHGGTYQGPFTSSLTGQPGSPIIVRQFPGERATIDCTASNTAPLTINGAWAWYWGFEIRNPSTNRVDPRGTGINIFGSNTKCINLVVHDTGVGIGFWSDSTNSEVCGCLVYHNGWQGPAPDRGHGHGIYAQNISGTKVLKDNILFQQFGYGVHIYTEGGSIDGFDLEGNVSFNNGIIQRDTSYTANYLVGGAKPASRLTFRNNFGYNTATYSASNLLLGSSTTGGTDLTLENNYIANGQFLCENWTNVIALNNTFAPVDSILSVLQPPGVAPYSWDMNHYIGGLQGTFNFNNQSLDFAHWQKQTGYDSNSQFAIGKPSGCLVFVRPNPYETNRANIIVFNWDLRDSVQADVSGVLVPGADFEVRNTQDFFGPPVLTARYTGQTISLPMTRLTYTQATGVESGSQNSWPEFNAFILLSANGPRLLPPSQLAITPANR